MDFTGMGSLLNFIQIFFIIVIGVYFFNLLKGQQGTKIAVGRESRKEIEKLEKMRQIRLSEPLSERTRPQNFQEIVGQEEGLKALRAALCGPNPQHIIIYGPPGVGKTAAARLVLEEAKQNSLSPFKNKAKFIEVDGATSRFDERGIADPLIGSVHDPIYQGAGAMGVAGIPQPKPGAVTKAHGGILFIDEIGELHLMQINKLLKVLEDRKVMLESVYYSPEDMNIPSYIHDVFQNGLPADFRLIGATTRLPQEIPAAIRSRCVEIYFRGLTPAEIKIIGQNAAHKLGLPVREEALAVLQKYATNGREAVNIMQIAAGLVLNNKRALITATEIEWVVQSGHYPPRPEKKIPTQSQIGLVNGLAVYGPNLGMLLEIEVSVLPVESRKGQIIITGIVEEEEMRGAHGNLMRRKSMAKGSLENVWTVLKQKLNLVYPYYDIHLNFPGGIPTDGPSAGVAMATAIYSAIKGVPVDHRAAMTGELSVRGYVKPVGGIMAKLDAARQAGVTRVFLPQDNWQSIFAKMPELEIIPVEKIEEVWEKVLLYPAKAVKILPSRQSSIQRARRRVRQNIVCL